MAHCVKDCLKRKVSSHYGDMIKDCEDAFEKMDWQSLFKCIASAKGMENPEIWVAAQMVWLGYATASCTSCCVCPWCHCCGCPDSYADYGDKENGIKK